MRIKSSTIGGSRYKIKYVKDLKNENGKLLFGRICQISKIIEINEDLSEETQRQALLHEDLHGVMWEYAIDDDEELVEPLSNGLFALIINNAEFIKLILKHGGK